MDKKYFNIDQLKRKTVFTKFQIRNWTSARYKNGLHEGVIKVGDRLFIDKEFFDIWVALSNKKASTHKPRKKKISTAAIIVPENFIITNETPQGEENGNDRICSMVENTNRTGFFRRVFDAVLGR